MLIPIADQRPGVELHYIGGNHPCDGHRVLPEAMEVAQGYETRFYECPADMQTVYRVVEDSE